MTVVQAALGGGLVVNGINGHGWFEVVLGGAAVALAIADRLSTPSRRLPARNTTERVLRYFGLR